MEFIDRLILLGKLTELETKGLEVLRNKAQELDLEETELEFINSLTPDELAYEMRSAENLHIEDINGRATDVEFTGEQAKWVIADFTEANLNEAEYEEFSDRCYDLAC